MGGWVLMTILCQVLILAGSVWTVIQINNDKNSSDAATKAKADNCDNSAMLCYICIGLAVMHTAISIYVQNAIVKKILADNPEIENPGAEEIMKATKHIIAYDFIFCFYAFALPGGTFYMCYALGDHNDGDCETGRGPAWSAAMAMIAYGFMTMFYLPCMYCGTCCASQTKKTGKKMKGGKGGPGPQAVGGSYA